MDQIIPIAPAPAVLAKDFKNAWDWALLESEISKLAWNSEANFDVSQTKEFFNAPTLSNINREIVKECELFVRHVCPLEFDFNLSITSSWVNKMHTNNSHPWHTHPFSVVSGVIFLDDCVDNLKLMFKTSMKEAVPPYSILELDYYTSAKDLCDEETNLQYHMILFYSNVLHSVPPLLTPNITRRTISFNTFWSGQVNFGDQLNSHNFK